MQKSLYKILSILGICWFFTSLKAQAFNHIYITNSKTYHNFSNINSPVNEPFHAIRLSKHPNQNGVENYFTIDLCRYNAPPFSGRNDCSNLVENQYFKLKDLESILKIIKQHDDYYRQELLVILAGTVPMTAGILFYAALPATLISFMLQNVVSQTIFGVFGFLIETISTGMIQIALDNAIPNTTCENFFAQRGSFIFEVKDNISLKESFEDLAKILSSQDGNYFLGFEKTLSEFSSCEDCFDLNDINFTEVYSSNIRERGRRSTIY